MPQRRRGETAEQARERNRIYMREYMRARRGSPGRKPKVVMARSQYVDPRIILGDWYLDEFGNPTRQVTSQ